jgi:hypothetical protein
MCSSAFGSTSPLQGVSCGSERNGYEVVAPLDAAGHVVMHTFAVVSVEPAM